MSLPPEQLKRTERLAKRENRTLSELVREALRQYEQKQESPINYDLIAALRAVQNGARRAGLDKLTQAEIDTEVRATRRARDKKLKQLVLGAAASALVPALTVLLLLNGGRQPLIGWGSLWQWIVMTAGGAAATPVIFALFEWCSHTLGYKPRTEVSFRPDREIHREENEMSPKSKVQCPKSWFARAAGFF